MTLFFKFLRLITFDYLPFRTKNELLILLFHQVNDRKSKFYSSVPTKVYQQLCLFLKKYYKIIHFSEVEAYYKSNPTKPAAIITFDDGMYDIIEHVLPFMEKHQLKFNINIDTEILETKLPQDFLRVYDILNHSKSTISYLDNAFLQDPITINYATPIETENEFTSVLSNLSREDKRKFTENMHEKLQMNPLSYSRVLSQNELEELSKNNLIEIGSHSHSHAVLTKIGPEEVQFELAHSKQILEKIIKKTSSIIAYPNGCSNLQIDTFAAELGYKYLLKTDDKTTFIAKNFDFKTASYYRINQYHQNIELLLAHSFGIIQKLKKIFNR